jgi:hypothetical protein
VALHHAYAFVRAIFRDFPLSTYEDCLNSILDLRSTEPDFLSGVFRGFSLAIVVELLAVSQGALCPSRVLPYLVEAFSSELVLRGAYVGKITLVDYSVPQYLISKIDLQNRTPVDANESVDALYIDTRHDDVHPGADAKIQEWLDRLADVVLYANSGRALLRARLDDLLAAHEPQPRSDRPAIPYLLSIGVAPPSAPVGVVRIGKDVSRVCQPIGAESHDDRRRQRLRIVQRAVGKQVPVDLDNALTGKQRVLNQPDIRNGDSPFDVVDATE